MTVTREDRAWIDAAMQQIERQLFGLTEIVRLSLVCLVSDGHVLLEGNPGLGKTVLVKTLASSLGLDASRWGRIQFTPDLMPSDITGTLMPDPAVPGRLAFKPGPIFHWLVLADEINRATPKTQAAMLEAMAERQVTVLGETHPLTPQQSVGFEGRNVALRPPFMVLATQNPIDQEGTFDLPEAQADRFLMKLIVPHPKAQTLTAILRKDAGLLAGESEAANAATPHSQPAGTEPEALARLSRMAAGVRAISPLPAVQEHILAMVLGSNGQIDELPALGAERQARLAAFQQTFLRFGLGPRAATALMLSAKAYTGLFLDSGGDRMVQGLAATARAVLRHRLKLDLDWEARYLGLLQDSGAVLPTAEQSGPALLDRLLADFLHLTAPAADGYAALLQNAGVPATLPPAALTDAGRGDKRRRLFG